MKDLIQTLRTPSEKVLPQIRSLDMFYMQACMLLSVKNMKNIFLFACLRGRNNSNISGSQQEYLLRKSGSLEIYMVVIWARFRQNSMANTTFEKYSQIVC